VEVSIQAAATDCAAPLRHGLTAAGGLLGGGSGWYGVYRARDGWVAVAALEDHFRERLREEAVRVAGAGGDASEPSGGEDPGGGEEPERSDEPGGGEGPDLAALFRQRSPEWWEAWARERDIPLVAVRREG